MDGSDMNVSSSSTPNKLPSISKGADENEHSYQEMGLNVQNSKKPSATTTTKHYMSPTISAVSKANPPRKKILAERNESLHNSLQNASILDSKTIQKSTSLDSKTTSSTEFDENEQNALVDDLSSKPYDPLTNYLSPRPKFLRYKVNRRQELFLRRENQEKEGKDGLTIIRNGSLETQKGIDSEGNLASSCGSLAAGFNETNVKEEGEEIGESEDELEEVYEERCWGFGGILKFLLLLSVLVFSTLYISDMNSSTPPSVVQAVTGLKDGYHMIQDHVYEFVKSLESGKYFLVGREGKQTSFVDIDGIEEEEMIEDVKIGEAEHSDRLNELVEISSGEGRVLEMVEDEKEGVVDELSEGEESEAVQIVEHGEKEIVDELQGPEAVEVLQMPLTNESSVPDTFEKENEMARYPIKEEIFDWQMGGMVIDSDDHEILIDEAEGTQKEDLIKHIETESILKAVIGFSVFSSIIASLVLALRFRKNRNARKDNHQVVEPCFDSVIANKCCSPLANEEDKHIEHPVSIANSRSLINSLEEDYKQTYESRAPTIELLGELQVEEMSSSLRSCGMKNRVIESEVSSYSVSMEKVGIGSNAASVPVRVQPALSQISNMNLPSYTDGRKNVKKEDGGDGEVNKVVVTTPLRRSSRIRNRSIAHPHDYYSAEPASSYETPFSVVSFCSSFYS
ncbi:hypothetical protein P3X46_001485 [Hevea brasiliensis]|uniref:Uncharacterized protein n=1 Tax=Hevea brasiliensis TaxID=3981 RepID=A0ABQ9NEK7_HEVBR|nr:uncharacterized protein LOC110650330 isoform X2 [Hevea brasiliensis]KAJ9190265.1 hypothetical protein P3X46_001485 [Hevea brasiliensis]